MAKTADQLPLTLETDAFGNEYVSYVTEGGVPFHLLRVDISPEHTTIGLQSARDILRHVLESYNAQLPSDEGQEPSLILEHIRDVVRAKYPSADYVTIGTDEWDNGYFFSFGLVQVSIKSADVRDTDRFWEDLRNWEGDLTDEFGPVGRGTRLQINLDTLETEINPL